MAKKKRWSPFRKKRNRGPLRRLGRGLARLVIVLLLLVAAGLAVLWFMMRGSVPPASADHVLAGLMAPVTVVRDKQGIPHIYARNDADAYRALGFMHARDRLFQMEMQRRLGQGRLAEVVGSRAVPLDRFMRTLGLYHRAKASFRHLKPATQAALIAYSAGVNDYLAKRTTRLPPTFTLLFITPKRWTPADSLVWGKLMALQLSTNWRSEILRAQLLPALKKSGLGDKALGVLWPAYPKDGPTTLPMQAAKGGRPAPAPAVRRAQLLKKVRLQALWAALPHGLIGKGASNEWAIDGTRTQSGKPILANDPHLGMSAPILWYLARIETPGLQLSGATVPGTPFHMIGHNGHVAWGLTTTYIDTDDLFIERIDPQNPARYLTPQGPRPFITREEIIHVRFGGKQRFLVRETRHGPVLDSLLRKGRKIPVAKGHVLALSAPWLSDQDTTADAIHGINRARNWNEFTGALTRYIAPLQNFAYADKIGNIGWIVPGRLPIRKQGDGFLPQPGWSGAFDWTGFVAPAAMPQAFNPRAGVLVNANNRIAKNGQFPHFLSREWGDSYRAERIAALLAATPRHDVASTARIQADVQSLMARQMLALMLPLISGLPADKPSDRARLARTLLSAWDGTMDPNRAEPLIFYHWFLALNRGLYQDELGPLRTHYRVGLRPDVVRHILTKQQDWCDDRTTKTVKETCDRIAVAALQTAMTDLSKHYGPDMAGWKWGKAHRVGMRHPILSLVPFLNKRATIRLSTPGGQFTVNKAGMSGRGKTPFAQRSGPGLRAIYPLADLQQSRFIIASGQSGHIFSPLYRNLAAPWRDVRYIRFQTSRAAAEKAAQGIITLRPPSR